MKKKNLLYLVIFIAIQLFACNQAAINYDPLSIYKIITPGVNTAFAAQYIPDNSYSLWGIKQKTPYDFGTFSQKIIQFQTNDSFELNSTALPEDNIAFPSNIQINQDHSSIILALKNNDIPTAYFFDTQAKYINSIEIPAFKKMAPIAIASLQQDYLILFNDTIKSNNTSTMYLVKTNSTFTTFTKLDSLTYDISFLKKLETQTLFNKYYLFHLLSKYSFIKSYEGEVYFNIPFHSSNFTSFALLKYNYQNENFDTNNTIYLRETTVVRNIEFLSTSELAILRYNTVSEELTLITYNISTQQEKDEINFLKLNGDKNIIFANNTTSTDLPNLVLGNVYNNQIHLLSPNNSDIDFSFGTTYESNIIRAYWVSKNNENQLVIFGNTKIFNEYNANYLMVIPESGVIP